MAAPGIRDVESVGTQFLAALVGRDWTRVEACFEAGVHFRALIPPGFCEAKDSASAVGHLSL
jgi:hypothetical protein